MGALTEIKAELCGLKCPSLQKITMKVLGCHYSNKKNFQQKIQSTTEVNPRHL